MPATGEVDLLMLGVLVLVFVAMPATIVLLIAHLLRSTPTRRRSETDRALGIVRARFARGEISASDYEAARRALGGPPDE